MTTPIDFPQLFQAAIINAISGLVANIFYIILAIWITKTLKKEIKNLTNNIPKYIDKWEKVKVNERAIEIAQKGMRGE